MSSIDYKDKGGILAPLKNLQFFARKPVTEPLDPRPASENYRGFHVNDWELCIGCSTCQKVCDNAAITMVRVPGLKEDPVEGVRALRPAIDYGRCCWCALCVDLCPTGSIALSREYVHTCVDAELDSYFILPDSSGIHGTPFPKGWAKSEDADMVAPERPRMEEMAPEARADNFEEIVAGYTDDAALIEASRCVQCGMCERACPEDAVSLDARYSFEAQGRARAEVLYEEEPFNCVRCGKPFATQSLMSRMRDKLKDHWMYQQNPAQLKRLQMCDDCRVEDLYLESGGLDPTNKGPGPTGSEV